MSSELPRTARRKDKLAPSDTGTPGIANSNSPKSSPPSTKDASKNSSPKPSFVECQHSKPKFVMKKSYFRTQTLKERIFPHTTFRANKVAKSLPSGTSFNDVLALDFVENLQTVKLKSTRWEIGNLIHKFVEKASADLTTTQDAICEGFNKERQNLSSEIQSINLQLWNKVLSVNHAIHDLVEVETMVYTQRIQHDQQNIVAWKQNTMHHLSNGGPSQ